MNNAICSVLYKLKLNQIDASIVASFSYILDLYYSITALTQFVVDSHNYFSNFQ
jgi:hypothetical protein